MYCFYDANDARHKTGDDNLFSSEKQLISLKTIDDRFPANRRLLTLIRNLFHNRHVLQTKIEEHCNYLLFLKLFTAHKIHNCCMQWLVAIKNLSFYEFALKLIYSLA